MTAVILPAAPPPFPPNNGRRYPSPLVKQELARLGKDAESRRAALSSLRAVVEEHLEGPGLQSFLQQLADSAEGRRHAAPLLADLAKVHGARLLPHINLLLHIVGHNLLQSSDSPCLQLACASSVSAIATNACLTHPPECVLPPLALPLVELLCHKVEALSAGAAACLRALVESEQWRLAPASLVAAVCRKAFYALTARCTQTVAHISLLRSLTSTNASALAVYGVHLIRLLVHEFLPSPCWQLRLAAVQLLESVLQAADYTTLTLQLPSSIDALSKCRHDKMPHIRKAATQALRTAQALASQEEIQRREQMSSKTKDLSAIAGHHQRSRSHESIVHDDDWLLSLSKRLQVTKSPLSSPQNHLSQTLFLSPRSLADFRRDSSPSKLQTPSSCDLSPGREPADESDYFCAYFCDSKEKTVPCRRIVHHIHDTPTTPKASPAKSDLASAGYQIPVPPLPLSDLQERQQRKKLSSSSAKDVTVLDSTERLLLASNRGLINVEASRQLISVNNAECAQVNESASSSDGQTPAEKHQAAMQDFQAICGQLLQLREEAENKFLREALQEFSPTSSQDKSEGEIIQGQGRQENDGNAKTASSTFSIDQTSSAEGSNFLPGKDNLLEIRDEMLAQCDDLIVLSNSTNDIHERELDEGVSCNGTHMREESTSAELQESRDVNLDTGAEASCNGDWSVRDNPIANEEHTGDLSTSSVNKNNSNNNLQGTEDSQGSDAIHSEEALADNLVSGVTKVEINKDDIKDEQRNSGVLEDGGEASANELFRSCNEVEIAQPKGCEAQEGEVVSISGRGTEAQPGFDATGSTTAMAPEEAGLMSLATAVQWQSASAICLDGSHGADENNTHVDAGGGDDDDDYVEAELCEEIPNTVGTSVTKKKSSLSCRGFLLRGIAGIVIPVTMAALSLHFDMLKQQPQLGITQLSFIPPT